jgi:hypothetical protein
MDLWPKCRARRAFTVKARPFEGRYELLYSGELPRYKDLIVFYSEGKAVLCV